MCVRKIGIVFLGVESIEEEVSRVKTLSMEMEGGVGGVVEKMFAGSDDLCGVANKTTLRKVGGKHSSGAGSDTGAFMY